MNNKPNCPNCDRSLPGGRFNACPACGFDLKGAAVSPSTTSAPPSMSPTYIRSPSSMGISSTQTGNAVPVATSAPLAASLLERKAKKCRQILFAFVAFLAISSFVPALWSFWSFSQLRSLIAQHGWGNVPENRLADALQPQWMYPSTIAAFFVALVLFLVLIYQCAKLLQEIGVSDLKWSPGWTVASLFIPIINLYRPWVGLNELERTLSGMVERGQNGQSAIMSARREFGFPTLFYAVGFFILVIANNILSAAEKELSRLNAVDQIMFYQIAEKWENFIISELILVVASMLVHSIYWGRIVGKMQKIARMMLPP